MDAEPDEYELARRAREGDREALVELAERSRTWLFRMAYAELRNFDDSQDAVAAALLRICRHVDKLREPERVRAWMQRIVCHEARRMAGRREPEAPLGWLEDAASAEGELSLLRLDVELALRALPRDEARAVALFYLARLSVRAIAGRIGRPEGTIRRWLHQGRRRLAARMEGYAPMTPETTPPITAMAAAIVSTDLDPQVLQQLVEAMKAAYFAEVVALGNVPLVEWDAAAEAPEFRLAEPLRGKRFVVLDESIGGRSAFERFALLKATAEAKEMMFGLLTASTEESIFYAAWIAGFDLCVAKPVEPDVFRRRSLHAWVALRKRDEDPEWGERLERNRKAFVFDPLKVHFTQQVYRVAPMLELEETRRLGHKASDTEHLLLGLIREENNATRLLEWMGVSCETIRAEIERRVTPGDAAPRRRSGR